MMPMLLPGWRLVCALLATFAASCTHAPESPAAESPAPGPAGVEPQAQFNVLGAADAPVTIIEFTDLQCPYCARFATQTFPRLRKAYIDTGRVRYASGDLPLAMHRHAIPAAIAARCAGEQGRYWEFRHTVFAAQQRLSADPHEEFARGLGLDLERFAACRADDRQLRAVRADAALAGANGLDTTPSFVIGRLVDGQFVGETIVGVKPFEFFAAKIDALLGGKDGK
jgi:protein-disulfide isomerase